MGQCCWPCSIFQVWGLIPAVPGGTCLLWDQPRGSNVEDASLGIELQGGPLACVT